jgi:hypothetical protein
MYHGETTSRLLDLVVDLSCKETDCPNDTDA